MLFTLHSVKIKVRIENLEKGCFQGIEKLVRVKASGFYC